jgi:hypothetical protein
MCSRLRGRPGCFLAGALVEGTQHRGPAVPREHRRAKTDRLDTELLKRAFLSWLRGESLITAR